MTRGGEHRQFTKKTVKDLESFCFHLAHRRSTTVSLETTNPLTDNLQSLIFGTTRMSLGLPFLRATRVFRPLRHFSPKLETTGSFLVQVIYL